MIIGGGAEARPFSVDGLLFSDERGGLTILGVSGSGTIDDPFVVIEEITGPTAAVLVVRGFSGAFGNRIGTYHAVGFALRKIVTNRTRFSWPYVDFELQETLGVSSDTYDGLSFGQGASSGRPFSSDRYRMVDEIDEPVDYISFQDGMLKPGETAIFNVVITDTTPIPVFFLIQRPNRPYARTLPDLRGRDAVVPPGAFRPNG